MPSSVVRALLCGVPKMFFPSWFGVGGRSCSNFLASTVDVRSIHVLLGLTLAADWVHRTVWREVSLLFNLSGDDGKLERDYAKLERDYAGLPGII